MAHNLSHYDDLGWFIPTRQALSDLWSTKCEEFAGKLSGNTCAEIFADVVDQRRGHVSIGCSLVEEQQQIAHLLCSAGLDDKPVFFFRQLIFLLDEFTDRIRQCYELLDEKRPPRQPKSISLWANRYVKHSLAFFIQHHAVHIFEDEESVYGYLKDFDGTPTACLRSGYVDEPITVIDEKWLENNQKPNLSSINEKAIPAVLIPKLSIFVLSAIEYYRNFVGFAKSHPQQLEKFQSNYHWPITPEIEEEIKRIFEEEELAEGQVEIEDVPDLLT